ncbi:MAG: ribosome silencing factor [Desulfonatronovibrio sp.]
MTYDNLREKLVFLAGVLHDKKAFDVLALDVSSYSSAFEGIVVASAQGSRHCRSLADNLLKQVKENNMEYLGMEGYQEGDWILVDLNDVIVHIFVQETRNFYNLEGFWTKGKIIDPGLQPEGENSA